MTDQNIEAYERAYRREKQARRELEDLLECKTRDLYESNAELSRKNEELKWNQTQIVQSEKMASLGQMAAGVAHEINNPVGFVLSNFNTLSEYVNIYHNLVFILDDMISASLARDKNLLSTLVSRYESYKKEKDLPFVGEDSLALLEETKEGLIRIRDIVAGLKSFAHVDEADQKMANINDRIEATLKLVWNEIKYKCTLHKDYGDIPEMLCYPGQLNQVFMNLLVNAAQAIEQKGSITIRTYLQNNEVVVSVIDTGSGISPENIDKLFNPFFTTKPIGKGTGLGLSISYGIVQRHGGRIEVRSALGVGSTFEVYLPLVMQPQVG
jgi:signal transduction histidine kinase